MTLALAALVASLAPGGPSMAEGSSTNGPCEAPRVFVESQAWWGRAPGTTGGDDFGHMHAGACIPERDTLRSSTTIPLQLIMHHNPGKLADISVVFKTNQSETTVAKVAPSTRTCAVDATCVITATAPIDIAKFDRSGLQEIRFRVFVDQPDGKRMHTSLNFQTFIENGKTLSNVTRNPYVRSKGWYTGFGYCEADVVSTPLPDGPVSGVVNFRVQQVDHGPDDMDPTSHLVALDANAHAGIPGTVLRSGPGGLSGTTIAVDTTKLSNGTHRLVQRADCASGLQQNSGVSVLMFEVRN